MNIIKKIITISGWTYKNEEQIKISFKYDKELIEIIKQIPYIKWSKTNKTWYIEKSKYNINNIFKFLKNKVNIVSEINNTPRENIDKIGLCQFEIEIIKELRKKLEMRRYISINF